MSPFLNSTHSHQEQVPDLLSQSMAGNLENHLYLLFFKFPLLDIPDLSSLDNSTHLPEKSQYLSALSTSENLTKFPQDNSNDIISIPTAGNFEIILHLFGLKFPFRCPYSSFGEI